MKDKTILDTTLDIQGHLLRRYDWTPKKYHPNTWPQKVFECIGPWPKTQLMDPPQKTTSAWPAGRPHMVLLHFLGCVATRTVLGCKNRSLSTQVCGHNLATIQVFLWPLGHMRNKTFCTLQLLGWFFRQPFFFMSHPTSGFVKFIFLQFLAVLVLGHLFMNA